MKRGWLLALLGLLIFLILLVATLPARVLLGRIPLVRATGVGGSLWSGHAADLNIQGVSLGRAEWRLFALPLLRGQLEIEAKIAPPNGSGTAHCFVSFKQDVSCSRVQAALPLQDLRISSLPQGWTGSLHADLQRLELKRGWPVAVIGKLDVRDIARTTRDGDSPFGSYRVEFPADAVRAADGAIVGALQDTGGPLNVLGTLRLSPDRTYLIEGRVASRAEASRDLARSLKFLGDPDAEGRREFSLSGSL